MSPPDGVVGLFSWFQKQLEPGGALNAYLWPVWRRKRAIRIPTESARSAQQATEDYACVAGRAEWTELPIPTVSGAEIIGIQQDYFNPIIWNVYFDLTLRIQGKAHCPSDCSVGDVLVDVKAKLPLMYPMSSVTFVLPGRIKAAVWLLKVARVGSKLADLDPEVLALVEKLINPVIELMRNSADLLCSAKLDMKGLQQKIDDKIFYMTAPPGSYA